MKTVSVALVAASLLALTACGGGAGNASNAAANAATTIGDLNTASTLPPVDTGGANIAVANTLGATDSAAK